MLDKSAHFVLLADIAAARLLTMKLAIAVFTGDGSAPPPLRDVVRVLLESGEDDIQNMGWPGWPDADAALLREMTRDSFVALVDAIALGA